MNKKESSRCSENMEDNEIVKKVQGGHVECFDVIIKRYEKKLFYYVMRFVKNPDEANDLVQNVLIKTLKHIDSFDCEKKFSSWIYRIAHNEAMNWLKGANKRKTISIEEVDSVKDSIEISDKTSTILDEWFQIELRGELENAVAKLPKDYAQVITMRYFEDKSYAEISEIVNKPTSSVGTLLRRAKKKLLLIVLDSEKF